MCCLREDNEASSVFCEIRVTESREYNDLGKQVKSEKERGYINFVKGEKENKVQMKRKGETGYKRREREERGEAETA